MKSELQHARITVDNVTLDMFTHWFDVEVVAFLMAHDHGVTKDAGPYAAAYDISYGASKAWLTIKQYRIGSVDLFLSIEGDLPALVLAIIVGFLGERYPIPTATIMQFVRDLAGGPEGGPGKKKFTRRETEVLDLLLADMGRAAIAEKLMIGVTTVKDHFANIARKLGSESASQKAIKQAARNQKKQNTLQPPKKPSKKP